MACSSGCPTPGVHQTWGECLRSKALQVAGVEAHQRNQGLNKELNAYVDARKAGLQPASTKARDVRAAWHLTDKTGTPFRADQ